MKLGKSRAEKGGEEKTQEARVNAVKTLKQNRTYCRRFEYGRKARGEENKKGNDREAEIRCNLKFATESKGQETNHIDKNMCENVIAWIGSTKKTCKKTFQ